MTFQLIRQSCAQIKIQYRNGLQLIYMDTGKHWKAGGQRTIMNIQFTKTKMQKFNQDSGDLEVGLELGTVGNAYIA